MHHFLRLSLLSVILVMTTGVLTAQKEEAADNYKKGSDLYVEGKFEAAIPFLEKSIAADSSYWGSHYTLGKSYAKTGQTKAAIDQYIITARQKPSADIYYRLATAFGEDRQYKKGLFAAKKAQEYNHPKAGDLIKDFEKALKKAP